MDKLQDGVQAQPDGTPTLPLEGIRKSYGEGTAHVTEVLHGIDLTLARSEFAALIGPSGSGKSTLLNIIGLLDKPSSGKLFLTGQEAENLPDKALTPAAWRCDWFCISVLQLAASIYGCRECHASTTSHAR